MPRLSTELKQFLVAHWVHLMLFLPGAIGWTVLHETAHALAVVLQGGQVTEFVWLPNQARWGHIRYQFSPTQPYSRMLIALAPYLVWLLLTGISIGLSQRQRAYSFGVASTIFVWLYVLPIADTANTALTYLLGKNNDFYSAFGHPTGASALGCFIGAGMVLVGTFYLQRRLYRERALSGITYSVFALSTLAAIVVLGPWGSALFSWGLHRF